MPAARKSPLRPTSQPTETSALQGDGDGCAFASVATNENKQSVSAAIQFNDFTNKPPRSVYDGCAAMVSIIIPATLVLA